MEVFAEILDLQSISISEATIRIVLAMAFGFVLGIDRDRKNKPIDFRAFMIVAVTTCIVAILGQEIYLLYEDASQVAGIDLAKIISGVLTGIGFLGAGAIIHRGDNEIVGTATGASIWASGGIGLALGFGSYALAFLAFVAIAIILIIGGFCMKKVSGRKDKEDAPS